MSFDIRTVRASDYVVAAICGCWKRESSVNPGIWESLIVCPWDYMHTQNPLAGGYGFGQWTNTHVTNMRCLNLHNYVTSHGYADGDGRGQIMFLGEEDIWNDYGSQFSLPYRSLEAFLNADSTDLPALVHDFLMGWEGVPGDAYQERLEAAQRFLTYIRQHANDNPADYATAISRNGYLSDAEMLHNVMFVYFALNGYLGSPSMDAATFIMLSIGGKRGRGGKFNVNNTRRKL